MEGPAQRCPFGIRGPGDAALVEAIVASAPDLLGFSLYTWNSERSLTIAGLIKARLPGVLVVIGVPVKFSKRGYYPTRMRVLKEQGVTNIILEGFVYRQAS